MDNKIPERRISLWRMEGVGLIGRDKFLKNKILPRIKSTKKRFILKGEVGVGKTAILQWAHATTKQTTPCAIVTCGSTHSDILDTIIKSWEVPSDAKKAAEKEREILTVRGAVLYVDDLHKATPKLIKFLKLLNEKNKISGAMLSGIRLKEELKYLLWSCEKYTLPRLKRADSLRLAERTCTFFDTRLVPLQVANASSGLPGRIASMSRSGEIQKDEVRTRSEEVDIAPLFMMCLACIVIFRYLGRAIGATDMVVLGGGSMVALLFVRGAFRQGKER
jgi:hypothetical protein